MIQLFIILHTSMLHLSKTIIYFRRELASGLKMFPKEAKTIGLKATQNAIEEVKWIARVFYECRCALATALAPCTKEAMNAILGHLKYFMEQETHPPLHLEPTPIIASPIPIVSLSCAPFSCLPFSILLLPFL